MPTIQSVSLICINSTMRNAEITDTQITQAAQALATKRVRAEILIVAPDNPNSVSQPITYRPIAHVCDSILEAVKLAQYEQVLILDANVKTDDAFWNSLELTPSTNQVTTYTYSNPKPKKIWYSALILLIGCLSRLLFRNSKSENTPGLVVFNQIRSVKNLPTLPRSYNLSPALETTYLICLAKLNGSRLKVFTPPGITGFDREPDNASQKFGIKVAIRNALAIIKVWWLHVMFPAGVEQANNKPLSPKAIFNRRVGGLSILLAASLLFFLNANYPLFEPDEARNAQLALNAIESNDWLSLTLENENYWDKPPLQIWLVATSYQFFGASPASTRLPIGLAAIGIVAFTMLLGRKLVGSTEAVLAGLMLLLCTGFITIGRYLTMDVTLTLCTTIALLCGYLSISKKIARPHSLCCGLAIGLGLLTKGPVVLVICLPPLIFYGLLFELNRRTLGQQIVWSLLPAVAIAGPWYLAMMIVHPEFIGYFFWKHHVVRFSDAFNHREPFWYYGLAIFIIMFPASYLLPPLWKFITSRKPEFRLQRTREIGFLALSTAWILFFFSLSESKLPTYILPAFPLICLMMGAMTGKQLLNQGAPSRISQSFQKLTKQKPIELVAWSAIFGIATFVFLEQIGLESIKFLVGLLIVAVLALSNFLWSRRQKSGWIAFVASGLFAVVAANHFLLPTIAASRSIQASVNKVQRTQEFANAPVVYLGRERYGSPLQILSSKVYFFDRHSIGSAAKFLKDNPTTILVSSKDHIRTLRNVVDWQIQLSECHEYRHLFVSRPQATLVAQEPTPIQR